MERISIKWFMIILIANKDSLSVAKNIA